MMICETCLTVTHIKKCKECKQFLPLDLFPISTKTKWIDKHGKLTEKIYRRKLCRYCYNEHQYKKIKKIKRNKLNKINNNLKKQIQKTYYANDKKSLIIDFDGVNENIPEEVVKLLIEPEIDYEA
jgi:hypothetical protein